jgi:hypothetical protein
MAVRGVAAIAALALAGGVGRAEESARYPAESYTAIVKCQADTTGLNAGEIQVMIAILRPLAVEEALPLRDLLRTGGQQALLSAIRASARGMLRLGGLEYSLDLVVEQQQGPTRHIVIVTTRPIHLGETNAGSASLDYPFGVAIFDVDELGRGEGTVYPKAALEILEDGTVGVSTFEDRTYPFTRMKREK